ncbi:MAG: ExbD/TolR family protein [Gemmatimonadaceae bacterium]
MTAASTNGPNFELNVTPMLDVLLVLLIIFMAAVMQVHRTIDVNLPIPCSGACTGDAPIVLEVLQGPAYRVNQRPVAANELLAYLTGVYRGRPDKIIQVAGDPHAKYADIVRALDIAKSAGVKILGVTTHPSS